MITNRLNILLVEDNKDHAELVVGALGEHRLLNQVCHVRDGEAALDFLYHRGEYEDPLSSPVPHLILLDLRLPRMDGLDILERIKHDRDLARIPVVVLTSSAAERDIERAYAARANSYLVKPDDFECFNELLEMAGSYWLGCNHMSSMN